MDSGIDINFREEGGMTALMVAADLGKLEMVQMLIKAGAELHHRAGDGASALMYAEYNGYTDVAEVLRKAGAVD
jgi:hypothetical protein